MQCGYNFLVAKKEKWTLFCYDYNFQFEIISESYKKTLRSQKGLIEDKYEWGPIRPFFESEVSTQRRLSCDIKSR